MAGTDWRVVSIDKTGSPKAVSWSPDGSHFLVSNYNQEPPQVVYDASGDLLREYEHGTDAAWVDGDRFVLLTYTNGEGGEQANGLLASVASARVDLVDVPFGEALPNGHGAIAFVSSGCDIGCEDWTYSVWTPENGATERLPGEPLGWSPDGQRLFVLRPPSSDGPPVGAPGRSVEKGWLEVISWPAFESTAQYRDAIVNDDLHTIDPSGTHMTFLDDDTVGTIDVVDTNNGSATSIPATSYDTAWQGPDIVIGPSKVGTTGITDAKGNYVTISPVRGTATVTSVSGKTVGTWDEVGSSVTGSPDGSIVAFWDPVFSDSLSFVTVIKDGTRSEFEPLPSDGYIVSCGSFQISPSNDDLLADCLVSRRGADANERVILVHPL